MITFKCSECGKIFEDTIYISPSPFEKSYYPVCPKCDSSDVYEI